MAPSLPKSFTRGGYIFSPVSFIICGLVIAMAGLKLVKTGQSLGITSYSLITLKLLGKRAKRLLDFMIAVTQFSFTLAHMSFMVPSFKSIIL